VEKMITFLMVLLIIAAVGWCIMAMGLGFYRAQSITLKEWNAHLRIDRNLWRDKATTKQGIGLLGQERRTPKPPENANPTPTFVTRATLEQRHAEKPADSKSSPIDVSVTSVTQPPRPIVAKAREILKDK
jgi:hypothetical protein